MSTEYTDDEYLSTYQGDTFSFDVSGIPTDINDYIVYTTVYDKDFNTIVPNFGTPASIEGVALDSITIEMTPEVTKSIPVEKRYVDYFIGVKACSPSLRTEHTLEIGDVGLGTPTKLRVYKQKVEGIE